MSTTERELNLTQVIENAAVSIAKETAGIIVEEEKGGEETPASETPKETKVETKETNKEEPPKKEETKEDDEIDPEQMKQAKALYKGLASKDPNVQLSVLRALAQAAGKDLTDITTKKEAVEAKKGFVELLKEGLGEWDFLGEKLGPILEQRLKEMVEEQVKPIKETEAQRVQRETRMIVDKEYGDAFNSFDNPRELHDAIGKEVGELMNNFKPTAKMSYKQYFTSLIHIAAGEKGLALKPAQSPEQKKTSESKEKIQSKTRNDVGSRLSSERRTEVKNAVRPSGKMNLDAAVNAAVEELAKK